MHQLPPHTLRSEVGATLRLAGPVVAAQLAQTSMGFVDTVMVGRLGSEALAGVALGSTVFFFCFLWCMGVVMAVGPMVAQAYGAGTVEPIGKSVRQGLWLGLVLAVPVMLLLTNIAPVLRALGQEETTVRNASAYLKAICWGLPPFLWFVALRNFAEGVGRPLPVTLIALGGVGLNIGGNYVLMYGKLGFPAMGLVGTAWASAFTYWMLFAATAVLVHFGPAFRRYEVLARLGRPDLHVFRELFRIGWPIGVSMGVEVGLFTTTAVLMGVLGTDTLAAHQIAIQCASFSFMVPVGVGIATSVRVGQAVGRRDGPGVRWAGTVGMGLAAAFMLGAALLFWSVPEAVIGLYLDLDDPANAAVVRQAVTLLGIAAVFQVFDGVQVSAAGALRGLKDTRVPMFICFVAYWVVGLPSGLGLGFAAGGGASGLWWGLVLGLAAAATLLSWRFLRQTAVHRPSLA
jgi:MATE family multidrug resistance protein